MCVWGGGGGVSTAQCCTADMDMVHLSSLHSGNRLVGLVVRRPPRQSADLSLIPAFAVDLCPGRVIPVT